MIIIIAKKLINGKWFNVDGTDLYFVGQVVNLANGITYKVTNIIGSKITLEEMVE